MAPALSVSIIFRENDLDLNFSFHQFVDKRAVHMQRKKLSLNLSVKVRDEVQNVFVNSFQSRSGL